MPASPASSLPTPSSPSPNKNAQSRRSLSHSTQQSQRSKKADNDAAVRAAKLHIRKKVREDWVWPPTGLETANPRCDSLDTEWCERESDSSRCPSPTSETRDPISTNNPYKFDSPDSLLDVKSKRKRKRHDALQEEMGYNEGLCLYLQRRDAWTGAISTPQSPPDSAVELEYSKSAAVVFGSDDSDMSSLSTSTSHLSTACKVGNTTCLSISEPSIAHPTEQLFEPMSPPTLVPLPPPILPPTNPIRAAISPATYPSIYNKIVVQGLSPTVPVNLKDVVRAMVDGWKKDGEWPPKDSEGRVYQGENATTNGVGGASVNGIGKALAKRGVGRMKRALGFDKGNGATEG